MLYEVITQAIKSIREAIDIPVQVGGGIRDEAAIKRLLDIGVDRVILGSYNFV